MFRLEEEGDKILEMSLDSELFKLLMELGKSELVISMKTETLELLVLLDTELFKLLEHGSTEELELRLEIPEAKPEEELHFRRYRKGYHKTYDSRLM